MSLWWTHPPTKQHFNLLLASSEAVYNIYSSSNSVAHIIHIILVRGIIQDQSHSVIQFALDRSELGRAFEEFDEVYRRSSDAIFLLYPSLIGTLPHDSMTGPIELMTDVMITQ